MNARAEYKVLVGFSCALLMLAVAAFFVFSNNERQVSAGKWVTHTEEALYHTGELEIAIAAYEKAVSACQLKGDCKSTFKAELVNITALTTSLAKFTADNPRQQKNIHELQQLLARKIFYTQTFFLANRNKVNAAAFLSDAIQARVDAIQAEERRLAKERQLLYEERIYYSSAVYYSLFALVSLILILTYRSLSRYMLVSKRSEEKLLYLSYMINNANDSIIACDKDFNVTFWNRESHRRYGYSSEEAVGRPYHELVKEEYFVGHTYQSVVNTLKQQGSWQGEAVHILQNGRHMPVLISVSEVKNDAGEMIGYTSVMRDITERLSHEKRVQNLNDQLEEKVNELQSVNKELESFSYSVSHDLRAPLRAINSYARILQEEHAAQIDNEGKRFIGVICRNAEKMGRLIDDLLAFSRLGRQDINKDIVQSDRLVKSVIQSLPEVTSEIKCDSLLPCKGDASMLRQVWTNLISNAQKYSSRRKKPEIRISSYKQGNEVTYSVADNGVGFDMFYYNKLFGVFQRLHNTGDFEGTGVGLAIVQKIVSRHGGKVWAEAEPDKGATFYFSLPLN